MAGTRQPYAEQKGMATISVEDGLDEYRCEQIAFTNPLLLCGRIPTDLIVPA